MKAIILAAGRGKRLKPVTDVLPKPTIKVKNMPLILSNFDSLDKCGINEIGLVVGYKADVLLERIGPKIGNTKITYIYNEEWKKENGISLLKAKEFVGDDNFLLLMADHVFEFDIIKKIVDSEDLIKNERTVGALATQNAKKIHKNIVGEATKILTNNNEIQKFGKKIRKFSCIDIGIFLLTPLVFTAPETLYKENKKVSVSDCMNWHISHGNKIISIDMTGKIWHDIDIIEDMSRK